MRSIFSASASAASALCILSVLKSCSCLPCASFSSAIRLFIRSTVSSDCRRSSRRSLQRNSFTCTLSARTAASSCFFRRASTGSSSFSFCTCCSQALNPSNSSLTSFALEIAAVSLRISSRTVSCEAVSSFSQVPICSTASGSGSSFSSSRGRITRALSCSAARSFSASTRSISSERRFKFSWILQYASV